MSTAASISARTSARSSAAASPSACAPSNSPATTSIANGSRRRRAAEELTNLVDVISTNHTHFFREEKHFDWLRSVLLPQWRLRHDKSETFRAWSAASSSGEEPYTLAIVLAEFFGLDGRWTIDATDISTRILARAEQAIYDADKITPVPPELLRRYFQRGVGQWDGHFRVREQLRRRVCFQHLNLLQPEYPFAQRFQLIFCRNVMIYFDRPTQETLVGKLTGAIGTGRASARGPFGKLERHPSLAAPIATGHLSQAGSLIMRPGEGRAPVSI